MSYNLIQGFFLLFLFVCLVFTEEVAMQLSHYFCTTTGLLNLDARFDQHEHFLAGSLAD